MMQIRFLFTVLILGLTILSFAQDSTYNNQKLTDRKVGIYTNYEEFLKNEPSITKAFKIMPIFYVDKDKKDSIIVGLTYQFLDSSKLIKKLWGLYDGEKTYYNLDHLFFVPFSYTGRYSMVVLDTGTQVMTYNGTQFGTILNGAYDAYYLSQAGFGLIGVGVSVIASSLINSSTNKPIKITTKTVSYINKRGELIGATDQAIGFLLKNEKDLSQAFNKEKKSTAELYIKYIMAMNNRYLL